MKQIKKNYFWNENKNGDNTYNNSNTHNNNIYN